MKKNHVKIFIVISILLLICSVAYFILIDKSFFGIIKEIDDSSPYVSIVFAGDAIPHKEVRKIGKNGFSSILRFLEKEVSADLFFYNLETTVLSNPNPPKPFYFSVQPSFVEDLYKNQFTYFTIANNHMLDFDLAGHLETIENVRKYNSVGFMENDKIMTRIIETKSIKIGFIGFTTKINKSNKKTIVDKYPFYSTLTDDLKTALNDLKQNTDMVICAVHWGNEYEPLPNEFQKTLAYSLIDNGVDIVWGHHPHVVQPFEIYNNKLILYSNGNLLSSQAMTYKSEKSGDYHKNYYYSKNSPIIKLSFDPSTKKAVKLELFPYFQFNNFHIKKKNDYDMFLYNAVTLSNAYISDLKLQLDDPTFAVLKWSVDNSLISIKNSIEFVKNTFFANYPNGMITNKDTFELHSDILLQLDFKKPEQ